MSYKKYYLVGLGNDEIARQLQEIRVLVQQKYGLKSGEAGYIGDIAIIPEGEFDEETSITVEKKERQIRSADKLKDYTFPGEFRGFLKTLTGQLKLTKQHLKVLEKEIAELEKKYSVEKVKGSVEVKAHVLRMEKDLKRFMKQFRSRYSEFFEMLISEQLQCLDEARVREICALLEDIIGLASFVRGKLRCND